MASLAAGVGGSNSNSKSNTYDTNDVSATFVEFSENDAALSNGASSTAIDTNSVWQVVFAGIVCTTLLSIGGSK